MYFIEIGKRPTNTMDNPSYARRTKAIKAKEKHQRNPYSSKHVRSSQQITQPKTTKTK